MVDVVRGDRLYSGLCLGTSTSATSPLAAAPARRLLSAPRAGVGGILSMRSYVGRAWSPGVEAVSAVSAGGSGGDRCVPRIRSRAGFQNHEQASSPGACLVRADS